MLSLYSKIINSPVVELKTQTRVGVVSDLVFNNSKLTISGIILKNTALIPNFLKNNNTKVISSTDTLELNPQAVIVNNEDSVIPLSEAVRIHEAISEKYYGIHQRVISKKGKYIGLVYDYAIDSTTCSIVKFYCKAILSEKIIPASQVIKIEGKKIYIKDEIESNKITEPLAETSAV